MISDLARVLNKLCLLTQQFNNTTARTASLWLTHYCYLCSYSVLHKSDATQLYAIYAIYSMQSTAYTSISSILINAHNTIIHRNYHKKHKKKIQTLRIVELRIYNFIRSARHYGPSPMWGGSVYIFIFTLLLLKYKLFNRIFIWRYFVLFPYSQLLKCYIKRYVNFYKFDLLEIPVLY